MEKREVKSNFKNVAGELKEKFGELLKSRSPSKDSAEKEEATAESSAEDSSDEEEGEVIVRPTARARSTVLLTIPEQRESGPEDSVTESTDKSEHQDKLVVCEHPVTKSSSCQGPNLLTEDGFRSPSAQITSAQRGSSIDHTSQAFPNDHTVHDVGTFFEEKAKFGPFKKSHPDFIWKNNATNLDKAAENYAKSEEDAEEYTKSRPPSLNRCSSAVPGVSDEELEGDMEKFKLEVGMLRVVFLDLEKEKAQLQKEVEDGRLSHSRLDRLSFSAFNPCTAGNELVLIRCFKLTFVLFLFVQCSFSMSLSLSLALYIPYIYIYSCPVYIYL